MLGNEQRPGAVPKSLSLEEIVAERIASEVWVPAKGAAYVGAREMIFPLREKLLVGTYRMPA